MIFSGPLPHSQVPAFVSLIDIAIQPAANDYCCPMKILEFLAVRKPVVAPRQQNIQDLQRDDEAEYFTPGDEHSRASSLKSRVENPEPARQMGEQVRRAIKETRVPMTRERREHLSDGRGTFSPRDGNAGAGR